MVDEKNTRCRVQAGVVSGAARLSRLTQGGNWCNASFRAPTRGDPLVRGGRDPPRVPWGGCSGRRRHRRQRVPWCLPGRTHPSVAISV